MNRWLWAAIAFVVLAAAGVTLVALPSAPEWTTSSPEALTEFVSGEAALRKVYSNEAAEHYRRAFELDPGFLAAKWRVAQVLIEDDHERATQLADELMASDLSSLTPRERFLIRHWRAMRTNQTTEATQLVDAFVAESPDDPYGVYWKATKAWQEGQLEEAERSFQRLLTINPNWVLAYNALGYIKMMQARFTEAEEYFKSYRFIAPDQANPHDSLGELFMTIGRYDEAEKSFERAIEIRSDFWASYEHLAILKSYNGKFETVRHIIERATAAGMPDSPLKSMSCRASYAEMAAQGQWDLILEQRDSECVRGFFNGLATIITHRAACQMGDLKTARELEDEAGKIMTDVESNGNPELATAFRAGIAHMKGIRAAITGDLTAAREYFQTADDLLSFVRVSDGMYKLYNRMLLAETLLADGEDAEAHQLLSSIRSVNPAMVEDFEESGLRFLGLGRG